MKTIQIGVPCSPARILSHRTKKVKKILVSYGGGLGGSTDTYYTTKINKEQALNGFWELLLVEGGNIEINPRFIVSVEDAEIVIVETDITDFYNRNRKQKVESNVLTEFIYLAKDETYQIVDVIVATPRHEGQLYKRVIYQTNEIK